MIKTKTYNHIVPDSFKDKKRLREYLVGIFPFLETGSAVKKAIQKNQIHYNGRLGKTGDWVKTRDQILFITSYEIIEKEIGLDILYEDSYLMVVRKPPGLSSSGNQNSFQNQLQSIELSDDNGVLPYPFLVHRLDKATEGLMIAAKEISARRILAEMLSNNQIEKRYVLIVEGLLENQNGYIDNTIDGKQAKTEIIESVHLDTKDPTTRVVVKLHTGRTHQIRKHFAAINHPIVGDQIYNKEGKTFGSGMLLCAFYLEFQHPISNESIRIESPFPQKISKYKALI